MSIFTDLFIDERDCDEARSAQHPTQRQRFVAQTWEIICKWFASSRTSLDEMELKGVVLSADGEMRLDLVAYCNLKIGS